MMKTEKQPDGCAAETRVLERGANAGKELLCAFA